MREVVNEPLPSKIKGRGMLAAEVETARGRLVVANVHLSLGGGGPVSPDSLCAAEVGGV